jgi:hypothetical protein
LSRISGGMPVPLSRTLISTAPPNLRLATRNAGRKSRSASRRRLVAA